MADSKGKKINKRKKSEIKKEDFLRSHGIDIYERSITYVDWKIEDRWLRDNALYDSRFVRNARSNNKVKTEVIKNTEKLFIPKIYSHLQRTHGDVMSTIFFDKDEIVNVKSASDITFDQRQTVKSLLNYRLNSHPINFYQEAHEFVQDALRNMCGIFKVFPLIKKNKKGDVDEFHPQILCIPYEDVFFAPEATWKDYYKHPIIHRMVKSMDELKRRGYKNLDRVEEASISTSDSIKQQRNESQGSPFRAANIKGIDVNSVYVYEIWTFIDINGDGLLESVKFTMAGNEDAPRIVISEIERNDLPYKRAGDTSNRPPFVVGTAFPESHKMYGKSMPQITEQLQREINAIRNQKREAVSLGIRSPLLVEKGSNIDIQSLANRRIGGIVMGDDISPSAIRELPTNTNFDSSYQELQITDNDFNQVTSVSSQRLGIGERGEQTATEIQSNQLNANRKATAIASNLIETGFIPVFENLLRLEQLYESDDFVEKVTGKILGWKKPLDNVPVMEDIQGDFDLQANMGKDKQTQLNKMITMLQMGNQSDALTQQKVQSGVLNPQLAVFTNPSELIRRIYSILGEKGDELFIPAQAPPPEQPQQQGGQRAAGIASQPALPEQALTQEGGGGFGA